MRDIREINLPPGWRRSTVALLRLLWFAPPASLVFGSMWSFVLARHVTNGLGGSFAIALGGFLIWLAVVGLSMRGGTARYSFNWPALLGVALPIVLCFVSFPFSFYAAMWANWYPMTIFLIATIGVAPACLVVPDVAEHIFTTTNPTVCAFRKF